MSELGAARHRARERAVELMYEAAMKDRPVLRVVAELAAPPDTYTLELLEATARAGARALELIGRHSIDWPVDRLALLDRLILTLATCELLMDEAPPGVLSAIADDVAHEEGYACPGWDRTATASTTPW